MASNWQKTSFPFVGGIDTKTDEKAVPVGRLVNLENGVFTKAGSIKKRWGYGLVKNLDNSDNAIESGLGLGVVKNELIRFGKSSTGSSKLYSYDGRNKEWVSTGAFTPVGTTVSSVVANPNSQTLGDSATVDDVSVYAWEDSRGGIYASIYNRSTGMPYASDWQVSSSGFNVQVLALAGSIYILYVETTTLKYKKIDPQDVDTSVSAVSVNTDLTAAGLYHAVAHPDDECALYTIFNGSDEIETFLVSKTFAALGSTSHETRASTSRLAMHCNRTEYAVGYSVGSTGVYCASGEYNGDAGTVDSNGTSTVDTVFSSAINRVTVVVDPDPDTESAKIYYEYPNNPTVVKTATITTSNGSNGGASFFFYQAYIAAHGWSQGTTKVSLVLGHESSAKLQNQYFVVDESGNIISRFMYGEARDEDTGENQLPNAWNDGNKYTLVLGYKEVFQSDPGDSFGEQGLKEVEFDYDYNPAVAEVGEAGYINSGMLHEYAGNSAVEAGFLKYPEPDIKLDGSTAPADHTAVTEAAGNLLAGTYGYRIYYEWLNTRGERERSSAVGFSVNVATGPSQISIAIPYLTLTNKSDVNIVVYRTTLAKPNTYFRISSPDVSTDGNDNGFISNNASGTTVTFNDDYKDDGTGAPTGLSSLGVDQNELDYQNSGELDNLAPEAATVVTRNSNRIFLAGGAIEQNSVVYSKLKLVGETVGFNPALFVQVDSKGGPITALATLQGTLIVFKKNHMFIVTGDGPNNLGFGGFNQPREISADIGCDNPRSIVNVPGGLLFQSEKGIWFLGNNLVPSYIGAAVEKYNDDTYSAVHVPDKNVVVFVGTTGRTLVFDYQFRQWGTFTNHLGLDAVLHLNKVVYMRTSGETYIQNEDVFTDGGGPFRLKFLTAPLRVGGLQEYWRCRRVYLLGDYKNDHELFVKVFRNRDGYAVEEFTWDVSNFINTSTWGSQATWGADDFWGGSDTREYQMSHRLKVQKYQTVQFEIVETKNTGEGYNLTELALEWAPMRNLARLPSARRS